MAIQFYDNKILFKESGTIAMDADCCCDACNCTTPRTLGDCGCLPSDFSDTYTIGGWSVGLSWSGSSMPVKRNTNFVIGQAVCGDLSGTYLIDCPTPLGTLHYVLATFCFTAAVDVGGFSVDKDFYNLQRVEFTRIIIGDTLGLRMACLNQVVELDNGAANPYSTITQVSSPPAWGSNVIGPVGEQVGYNRRFDRTYTALSRSHYPYTDCDPAPTCTENAATGGWRGCNSGSSTWSAIVNDIVGTINGCNLSGTTATIAFRAPIAPPP